MEEKFIQFLQIGIMLHDVSSKPMAVKDSLCFVLGWLIPLSSAEYKFFLFKYSRYNLFWILSLFFKLLPFKRIWNFIKTPGANTWNVTFYSLL